MNPLDDLSVAAVLQGVHDLLSDALVPQRHAGALETKVQALARVADEGLEGRRHPTAGAHGTAHPGQRLEAVPAGEAARQPVAADAALREEEVGER
ncbi:MAG TPA: hypothetical protein VK276_03335 [Rubrobacteraceae bacterium]|nr:hypothetical protein [Rubrobacteraceae bacterium]